VVRNLFKETAMKWEINLQPLVDAWNELSEGQQVFTCLFLWFLSGIVLHRILHYVWPHEMGNSNGGDVVIFLICVLGGPIWYFLAICVVVLWVTYRVATIGMHRKEETKEPDQRG
jgi:hypothetical protein